MKLSRLKPSSMTVGVPRNIGLIILWDFFSSSSSPGVITGTYDKLYQGTFAIFKLHSAFFIDSAVIKRLQKRKQNQMI